MMKKFFVSLLVALCGAVSLFADDVADVKAVIIRDCELGIKGDFAGVLALRTRDYQGTDSHGVTFNYEQTKWMLLSLDGKHPVEFWLFLYTVKHDGAMPPEDQLPRMYRLARTPKYVELYEKTWPMLAAAGKAAAESELRTLKFIDVRVSGNRAVAVLEYSVEDEPGAPKTKIEKVSLRKFKGAWRMYRCVTKDK